MLSNKSINTSFSALVAGTFISAALITNTVSAGDMQHQHAQMSKHSGHQMEGKTAMQMMAKEVITEGVVSRINGETAQLIIHHQPIPEWKMSEMQMKFGLGPGLALKDFEVGQQIRFRLQHENMMKFTITEVLK